MADSPTPLSDRLVELDRAVDEAREKRTAAKKRRERERHRQAREVTGDLLTFRDDIAHKKPTATREADRPERQRELTEAFCAAVLERGLIVEAVGNGGGVTITDPSIDSDVLAADRDVLAARRERDAFAEENADAIRAEVKAAEAATIREALEGDDPEAIREAITGPRAAALTTADLSSAAA
jgi:hypothetical protein